MKQKNLAEKNIKSRKGLIFKIAVWTEILLFVCLIFAFGIAVNQCKMDLCGCHVIEKILKSALSFRKEFFIIYGIGIIMWAIFLFLKQTQKKLITFTIFAVSTVLGIMTIFFHSGLFFCLCLIPYLSIPVILAIEPKKVKWYILYLLFGFGIFILVLWGGIVMRYLEYDLQNETGSSCGDYIFEG